MSYKGVIFDLDGTILNSTQLNVDSFQYACEIHLGKRIDEKKLLKMYGKPLLEQMNYFCPEKAEDLIAAYREFSQKYHDEVIALFPGVEELLEQLKTNGLIIALVTSKSKAAGKQNLEFFNIEHYFEHLIFLEDVEKHKPHPDPYEKMIKLMGLKPSEIISIGDSPFDIMGSKRAGLTTVLVGWTTFKTEDFINCQPDYIVNDFKTFSKMLI
ncbi:HAD family hydrolase [Desulfitibacter alkalitolerans]|uniref:HAD family hydrolase n=1 Tax=Desulfitibacter alkalitolerans TaxID=264641 RepID=UPI000480021F|nr:HAD-IA family hydrolase [Desulfitibacter alkalitolerans]